MKSLLFELGKDSFKLGVILHVNLFNTKKVGLLFNLHRKGELVEKLCFCYYLFVLQIKQFFLTHFRLFHILFQFKIGPDLLLQFH